MNPKSPFEFRLRRRPVAVRPLLPPADARVAPVAAPPAPVEACRHCDHPEQGHGWRYAALPGWHEYSAPSMWQRERRGHAHTVQEQMRGGAA